MDKPKMRPNARPLADLVPACLGEALAAQGFAGTEIVTRWGEIAGPLARHCDPVKIIWPKRRAGEDSRGKPATLVVRVSGAFALDLQMQAPVIIERANRYFGWACIGEIRIKQGSGAPPRPAPRPLPKLPAEREQALQKRVSGIEDERLADALLRLGRGVAARRRS